MLYNRRIELIINGNVYDSDNYDIEFNVPFTNSSEPDIAEISIYNISSKRLGEFKKGNKVTLSAGYNHDVGIIATGEIESIEGIEHGVDTELRLFVFPKLRSTAFKETFPSGMTNQQILNNIVGGLGLEVGSIKVGKVLTYSTRAFKGELRDIVLGLVADSESKFYVKDNKIYIAPLDASDKTDFTLNANTGLIGSPQVTEIDGKAGWKIESLLNHRLSVNSVFKVQSKYIGGTFKVVRGVHSDFITSVEVIEA